LFVLSSCDKAKETMDSATEKVSNVAEKAGDVAKDAADKAGEVAGDAVDKVGDAAKDVSEKAGEVAGDAVDKVTDIFSENGMVGTWTGKLDGRVTTLTIAKQEGNNFEGKIKINYRNPVKQEVKGTFNTETKTITMEDQLHSRYKGKYSGKLSDDGKSYSGIFTTDIDKKNFKFKLVKK
jgi:ElaB/YqjD/DUF883 family membrane-anchored ribosome-binding protein